MTLDADPASRVKPLKNKTSYGKVWILAEICLTLLPPKKKPPKDYGKSILDKAGNSDLAVSMEPSASQPFNGFVSPVAKTITPSNDAANFSNPSTTAFPLEPEQSYSFTQMANINSK